jgi:hypothetical protein
MKLQLLPDCSKIPGKEIGEKIVVRENKKKETDIVNR